MITYGSRNRSFLPEGTRDQGDGVWLIRRNETQRSRRHSPSRGLERETKLELQSYVTGKLHELRTLPVGWDDADGKPCSQSVTQAAYRTLDRLSDHQTVFPFITPGEDGAVVLEWRAGRERLEFEFSPAERPYVRYSDPSGAEKVSSYLGEDGTGYEAVRAILSALSLRVWAANPAWKRLFH
ncbi:hypothetical protein ACFWIP_10835 [Streptomyces anulatus]|uniref:hypothetical protein n=1 Tax=Streptomyces TaxID=1883 RepID=UPI00118101A1|nr:MULTISPECIES: hypothetical protein [unclassified Streptomyces]